MAKGRTSTRTLLEDFFKKPIHEIFSKHFKGIKTLQDAVQTLSKITNGKIQSGHVTICKMIYECNVAKTIKLEDFPFANIQIDPNAPKKRLGKKPISEILEEKFKKPFTEILMDYRTLDKETAAQQLGVSVGAMVNNTIQEIEKGNLKEDDFSIWLAKGTGHRGRKSISEILEEKMNKSFAEIIMDYRTLDKETAAQRLDISVASLVNNTLQEIEKGTISSGDFSSWLPKQKKEGKEKKEKKPQENKIDNGPTIKVIGTCSECGNKTGWITRISLAGPEMNIGIIGRRCPKCGKWGTFEVKAEYQGIKFNKKVVDHDGLPYEDFVDIDNNIVENPFNIDGDKEYSLDELQNIEVE